MVSTTIKYYSFREIGHLAGSLQDHEENIALSKQLKVAKIKKKLFKTGHFS